jgi:hypothetical protein
MLVNEPSAEPPHLPTFLRDGTGAPVFVPVTRPSVYSLVFMVGLVNVAGSALAGLGLQHHTAAAVATYTLCGVLAVCAALTIRRRAYDDRAARICVGLVGLGDLALAHDGAPPVVMPALFVGATAAATLGCQLVHRRARRCEGRRAGRRRVA